MVGPYGLNNLISQIFEYLGMEKHQVVKAKDG